MLAGALAVDALWGEVPARVHPVVWMGRCLDGLERRAPRGDVARLVFGGVAATAIPALWALGARLTERHAPWWVQALALTATFSGRALLDAGGRVQQTLEEHRLGEARAALRWLVSRPTGDLDAPRVAAAAVESLAENFVDSWVAPLLAYAAWGLPGAYAWRAANTADAMWGYRTPRYERLGKASARLDDAACWLPARVGALLLALAHPTRAPWALAVWRRDAGATASPNAGQSMAAMAGLLDARLEKVGHYSLHGAGHLPAAADLAQARRIVGRAMVLCAAGALAVVGCRGVGGNRR